MAHELFHSMGAVDQSCATNPNADGYHVGDYDYDLMAGPRRRGRMLSEIDVNNDDYYLHGIPGCPDTADSPLWMDPPDGIASGPPPTRQDPPIGVAPHRLPESLSGHAPADSRVSESFGAFGRESGGFARPVRD